MSAQLSYAPAAVFQSSATEYVEAADGFSKRLMERVIPACVLRYDSPGGLGLMTDASLVLVRNGILPIVELHPADPALPLRNLVESCVLGILNLVWTDGEPTFDIEDVLGILNGTGRFRLPIDMVLHFRGRVPESGGFGEFVQRTTEFAKRYGHIQVVNLAEIPAPGDGADHAEDALERFRMVIGVCPRTLPAVGASLWVNYPSMRAVAGDLGIHPIDPAESSCETFRSNELKGAELLAKQLGLPVAPRLPLVPRFYRKGWYSFEVGKVLDSWVDRNPYRAYKDRPGWLED